MPEKGESQGRNTEVSPCLRKQQITIAGRTLDLGKPEKVEREKGGEKTQRGKAQKEIDIPLRATSAFCFRRGRKTCTTLKGPKDKQIRTRGNLREGKDQIFNLPIDLFSTNNGKILNWGGF